MENQEEYWSKRYEEGRTGWDIGSPSTPIVSYFQQVADKEVRILIPGAGNAYEAEYLWKNGFTNVHVLDVSRNPLDAFQERLPSFPKNQLLHEDFFEHQGKYDLIVEQTFFCSFEASQENRTLYARTMANLLTKGGKLIGLWFKHPYIHGESKRPFGGTKVEYLSYLSPLFNVRTFEDCYNSIPPRATNELFGIFIKK